ncbi:protein virilizer homolog [Aplysia californica]|uniref:Protein virilizer homolog n=1 Tax=Aplysia californica TaxID=6500 RepID=A0ABM0JFR2_APLCA|nr:protein virilizer homolog [Aplysia californica]
MASSEEEVKLLFFDTFYHDQNKEELNIDLIQFSQPVVVYEVRVIPLKTQVETNLGKGFRLGGTLPSEFKLDIFVNNLNKPTASTFEKLGRLDYKENTNIQLKPEKEVPTDGLILKGWYRIVTFAVYGRVTVVKPPQDSPPPPPPPLPAHQGMDVGEEESHKQQHPLDYINAQLQQQRQKQQLVSTAQTSPSPTGLARAAPIEEAFSEVLRKPSPHRDRGHPSSHDRDRPSSRDRDRPSSRDRDHANSRERDRPASRDRDRPGSRDRDRPSHDRERPSSREQDHPMSRDRDHPSSRDRGSSGDRVRASSQDSHDLELRRDYTFPPEPKEPYDSSREKDFSDFERSVSRERDTRDRDFAFRSSRDEEVPGSRERDREFSGRESREDDRPRSKERDREIGRRDKSLRHSSRENEGHDVRMVSDSLDSSRESRAHKDKDILDRDLGRDELHREKERERDAEKERERQREKEEREQREYDAKEKLKREQELKEREIKEREKELQREHEREREKEIQRDRERDREREMEIEKERERERDHELREKEQEREREKERDRDRDLLKEKEKKTRPEHERRGRPKTSPRRSSVDRSRSRSGSRSRKRSRSRQRSRSRSAPRNQPALPSEEVDHPPELHLSDEADLEEVGIEEEEDMEDVMSDRSNSRRPRGQVDDAEAQETEGYEDISSDEEMGVMDVPNMMQVLDMYELEEESWPTGGAPGNPLDFYLTPLTALNSPAMSCYQVELSQLEASGSHGDTPREALALLDILSKFDNVEHQDRWVMAMEEIPALLDKGLPYLVGLEKRDDVLSTLMSWVMEGCDPDLAMTQPDAAIKVRHLKVGIKLAGLLCTSDEEIALGLLRRGVQARLLSLLESQFIMFSFKHQALRALSRTTHFPAGILWFVGRHSEQSPPGEGQEDTGYQRLVKSLLKPMISKLTMSASALLRKIHFYEALTDLYSTIERVMDLLPSIEELQDKEEEEEDETFLLREEDENKILANLEEVTNVLSNAHELIGQAPNANPYNLLVDTKLCSPDTGPAVYNVASACCLLESVLALLATPAMVSRPSVYLAVQTLLQRLLEKQDGLLFLGSHPDTSNGILRCLLQTVEDTEESGEEVPSRQLGMEMVYHLQVLAYVDQLLTWHNSGSKVIDDADVITALHGLHTMSFSSVSRDPLMGRHITAKVIALDKNLEALLPFLEKSGEEVFDGQLRKSVSANYTVQLLLMLVKTSSNASMLEHYAPRMLALCQDSSSTKLTQLQEWLLPTKSLTSYDLDGLPAMIAQMKLFADDVKKVPPGLITVLRIISSLLDSISAGVETTSSMVEAKCQFVVELYSADCFPIFMNILQKFSESQLKVWQQGVPYTSDQWCTYFSLIQPTLRLVHVVLGQLIQAFATECRADADAAAAGKAAVGSGDAEQEPLLLNPFRDLTSVPVLLELHTVICSVPTSSLYSADLAKIQQDVVDTLLTLTQEEPQTTQTDDALNKSLWTLMLKELLRYTIKSPYTYMSGLLVLSELLPLPFPLHTKEALSEEEVEAAVVSRKLWSVHLQAATAELFAVLDTLSGTGCQPLQHLMRRVCWQIADLAAPSALRITKILLDILMVNLKPKRPTQTVDGEKKEGEEETTAVRTVSIHTAKTLNLLAYLLSHPGIKAALLQLIGTSIHSEVKYKDFLLIMLQLLNQTAETPAEIQAQEGIVSMIQSLCDLEVSMVNTEMAVTLAEHLANSLPESVLMADVTAALLEHVGNSAQSYASILPCLRILSMLTDHDYGFFHLTMNLESNLRSMHSLLNRINNTFSKDSSDCLSTLSASLELLRLLITIDSGEEEVVTRTKVISRNKLRHFLLWRPDMSHPLEELEELSREEETLESLLESITALTSVLRNMSDSPPEGDTNVEEVLLPVPALLTELFRQRPVYTVLEAEDERLSPSYWLANPALDEPDAEPEVLRCSLQALCEQHLVGFSLEQELQKDANTPQEDIVRPKRPRDRRKSHEVINIYRGKPGRKPFVAPMRGRGIMSHGMSGRGNDLFRSRTPNTSRPPSMHVDDFVKMENSQQQQQQQQQQPQQPPPPQQPSRPPLLPSIGAVGRDSREKELGPRLRGGDRMGGFAIPSGRFFTPPGSYRREAMLHEPHPLPPLAGHPPSHRGVPRGGPISMERNRPNFMAQRQFSRGPERMLPPPHERHGGRTGRFSPTGRGGRGGQWGRGRDLGEPGGRFAGGSFQGRRDPGRHVRSFTK